MSDARNLQRAWGLLFLRLSAAAMLASHGWDKIVHLSEYVRHFPDPLGVGSTASTLLVIFAEVFCTLLVMFGFLTRLAAVPVIATLVGAALWVHADDPWSKKEFALLYAIPFLTILMIGPGRFSLDALRAKHAKHAKGRRLFKSAELPS